MKDKMRFFYYFIIGAIGGLSGWFIGTLLLSLISDTQQSTGAQAIFGGMLGASVGVAVAAYDGIANRSALRFFKFGSIGFMLGAIAGAIALPLAQWMYSSLISASSTGQGAGSGGAGALFIGTFCWLIFGGLIGLGEGISKGTQSWKGILGGVVGGLCGGFIYELNRAVGTGQDPFLYQLFLAISFLLLGAAISGSVALVTSALKSAWVEIMDGKFSGRSYDVTKYIDAKLGSFRAGIIGSDQWKSHIYLPGDGDVLPHHAEINFANGAPTLTVTPEASKHATTFINGRRLTASSPLSDGDQLQFGSTKLIYRQKRR